MSRPVSDSSCSCRLRPCRCQCHGAKAVKARVSLAKTGQHVVWSLRKLAGLAVAPAPREFDSHGLCCRRGLRKSTMQVVAEGVAHTERLAIFHEPPACDLSWKGLPREHLKHRELPVSWNNLVSSFFFMNWFRRPQVSWYMSDFRRFAD